MRGKGAGAPPSPWGGRALPGVAPSHMLSRSLGSDLVMRGMKGGGAEREKVGREESRLGRLGRRAIKAVVKATDITETMSFFFTF